MLPECLDDFIAEDNTVRIVDAFIDELDLAALGFEGATPASTGRPSYHPAVLLKLYLYGYLNRIQSSRRLERECQRNVELMWLTGRLAPDFKTIADFRCDNESVVTAVLLHAVEQQPHIIKNASWAWACSATCGTADTSMPMSVIATAWTRFTAAASSSMSA